MNKSSQFSNNLSDYAEGAPVTSSEVAAQTIQLEQEKLSRTLPTLAVGDSVVILLEDETQQSAIVTHFSVKNKTHRYAHFAWNTGPDRNATCSFHSSKWAHRVIAVFPAGCKFLAV